MSNLRSERTGLPVKSEKCCTLLPFSLKSADVGAAAPESLKFFLPTLKYFQKRVLKKNLEYFLQVSNDPPITIPLTSYRNVKYQTTRVSAISPREFQSRASLTDLIDPDLTFENLTLNLTLILKLKCSSLNQTYPLTKAPTPVVEFAYCKARKARKARKIRKNCMAYFCSTMVSHIKTFQTHRSITNYLRQRLLISCNVERNPGPRPRPRAEQHVVNHGANHGLNLDKERRTATVLVTTYNVRGLKDEFKLRHLLSNFNSLISDKNKDVVVCLQETYIENPGKLPYIWRGNFNLTPGIGNSGGCVTLLSSHINVVACRNLNSRGHILACQRQGDQHTSFVIANIYAPNPNNADKIEFFNELFDLISEMEDTHDCSNIIIAGDFNLTFSELETKNRLHTSQEKRVAAVVKGMINNSNLQDVWTGRSGFTWKRANADTFSTIDRILFSPSSLELKYLHLNWALSFSDHALVEAGFVLKRKIMKPRSKIPRIDPSLAKCADTSRILYSEVGDMMRGLPQGWDPHMKLEFLKVSIRTVCERLQAERKRREIQEEDILNDELNEAISILSDSVLTENRTNQLLNKVEELRSKKTNLIDVKGRRLAERLGTKWYNEGEKSNKYFMRLLNRSAPDDFEAVQRDDGSLASNPEQVSEEIRDYYKKLYENFDAIQEQDDDEFFANISPISVPDAMELVAPVSPDELRATLQSCKDSTPGPDGIPYSIIGLLWPIFGQILCDSWNHSLRTGKLPTSHKQSYLKLIPKAGKDKKLLTNWRPITLSNCDHKIITKTYSNRMCQKVAAKIAEGQTAYIKGRLINDNIRSMVATLNLVQEERIDGLLVALDAKKAFDSVSHSYIEKCLESFGCSSFIPIFRVLYKDLATDIIINGRIEKGFLIKRGVKQGDALSCIIFIICMEPLLRNIEANNEIQPIISRTIAVNLPKTYAYADDVNATIKDSPASLCALFNEYERLTRMSGLELNAQKTEIMRLGNEEERSYRVQYLNKSFSVTSIPKIKINGIIFHRERVMMEEQNVNEACKKMDHHFKTWSRRSLTTLGKILITKTFGISQCIFLMQSLCLSPQSLKKVNTMLFKFIWNKHYLAAKAPERIKRDIVNQPIKFGGLGMLDIVALDESLKLKALGRLLHTQHPFLKLIKNRTKLNEFFEPQIDTEIESVTVKGLSLLASDRKGLWENNRVANNLTLTKLVRETGIKHIVSNAGAHSIPFFMLWSRGARKVKDLNLNDLAALRKYVKVERLALIERAVRLRVGPLNQLDTEQYFIGNGAKPLGKCTSQELRSERAKKSPLRIFKIGLDLTEGEALSWGLKLSKLTSTKHKNTVLRVAHGDIYTMEKLFRFGLAPDPLCPRCGGIETLTHKFIECGYVQKIWDVVNRAERQICTSDPTIEDRTKSALGAYLNSNNTILTLNAEILDRILRFKPENYLLHPKFIVRSALKSLLQREQKEQSKTEIKSILESV